jgi:outer membrane protein assembly factor BamD
MASPGSNLDQSASIEAMISMQDFLNRYPQTSYLDKAVEVINNIQVKLEKKGFENAKQYYRTRSYKAAITAFDNFKKNFPDSNLHEEADYLVIESIYKLAVQSFQSKQKERYQQVVDRYLEFLDKYPKSKFLNPAEKMYADSIIQLAKLKNVNS